MAKMNFSVDYFIDTAEDGSLSLGTSESRFNDAVKLFEGGDTILLTGLKKIVSYEKTVTNESELKNAIDEHVKMMCYGK